MPKKPHKVTETWRCFSCKRIKDDCEETPLGYLCEDCAEFAADMSNDDGDDWPKHDVAVGDYR